MTVIARGRDQDRTRIALNEDYEVRYWMEALHVTQQELEDAVRTVGNSADRVREYFSQRTSPPA